MEKHNPQPNKESQEPDFTSKKELDDLAEKLAPEDVDRWRRSFRANEQLQELLEGHEVNKDNLVIAFGEGKTDKANQMFLALGLNSDWLRSEEAKRIAEKYIRVE